MADVHVSAQLQQWTFTKTNLVRPERSGSSASSPNLCHHEPETLRIDTDVVDDTTALDSKETPSFQERYLSSEEDLSPMEEIDSGDEYDGDDASIHDGEKTTFSARKMSVSRFEKGRSCDLAVIVSIAFAGRPKMIEMATVGSPVDGTAQRSASLAQLPIAAINKLRKIDQASRLSLSVNSTTSRSSSPAPSVRRPSLAQTPVSHQNSSLHGSLHSSDASSVTDGLTTRSHSPSVSEKSTTRPASAAAKHVPIRTPLYIPSNAANRLSQFPPLTPMSPGTHAFLSTDPYENSTTSSASPIIKSSPHKRLRSISQRLSLAKIAITPSTKKWDSRINGRSGNMPLTPATPATPMTAPPTMSSMPMNKLRRNSRASRPTSVRIPSPDMPRPQTSTQSSSPRKPVQRLVPRGANEREPAIELPPCPVERTSDPMGSLKAKRIRKRKSLMSIL
ncbi:hypothetical protein P154DRAFT_539856 [Amniculicola lignicola CBS 123094]|uniref:Uncharacterized protein n=1 Tax=Amniculicola lignicola CBS 123094 TaxID=1392246 RepID=A0A6A5W4T6_9PLEO|nr:hypothetical protein P154DRAFT_539856 [Amniculicola lignicola CBS 123094]